MRDPASDLEAISALLDEHVEAVNSTDVELLLLGFTDDVVYIAPGMAPVQGKNAMREYIAPVYDQASINIAIDPAARELHGDRAVEWGRCRGEMSVGDDKPVVVNLQYILVYRREPSGAWRISHDISTPGPDATK